MNMQPEPLLDAATAARDNAWAPYSGFRVGAAILAEDGRIFGGCNVENASYGLTLCAERSALFKAVSEGARRFRRMLILTDATTLTPPCGACRQAMSEFVTSEDQDFEIVLSNLQGKRVSFALSELYPHPFNANSIS